MLIMRKQIGEEITEMVCNESELGVSLCHNLIQMVALEIC